MRKVAIVGTRLVGAAVGTLIMPGVVLWLIESGFAGSWELLPACLGLMGLVAVGGAILVWRPYRRFRLVAAGLAMVWAGFALSTAYWPGVATLAEVRSAYQRIDYDGALSEPDVAELGTSSCSGDPPITIMCPHLSARYRVGVGESGDVLEALREAGFRPVGEPRRRALENPDLLSGGDSHATGWRHWLRGNGMRVEVTVVTDEVHRVPVPDLDNASMISVRPWDEVSVEISSTEHGVPEIPKEIDFFWSPHAPLDDLPPPPGW